MIIQIPPIRQMKTPEKIMEDWYNDMMIEQALFLSCGLIMMGVIFGVIGALNMRRAASSLGWPTAPGEVLASRVEQGDGGAYARVRYRYRVAEKTYTGARVSFREGPTLPGLPAEPPEVAVRRYPSGKIVQVHYDPSSPDRSVLEPGAGPAAYLPLAAGGLFFVLGLVAGMAALF